MKGILLGLLLLLCSSMRTNSLSKSPNDFNSVEMQEVNGVEELNIGVEKLEKSMQKLNTNIHKLENYGRESYK